MKFSKTLQSITWFFMLTTSAYAMEISNDPILVDSEEALSRMHPMIKVSGNPLPLHPEDELAKIQVNPSTKDIDFQKAQEFEQEKKYSEAALYYRQAGVSGHSEAFIRLGYLYECHKLEKVDTVEERRLMDSIASFYIGEGIVFEEEDGFEEVEDEVHVSPLSLADIQNDGGLSVPERFFKIGEWYEKQRKPDETPIQRRLRYAYAGRYYEEAALWHFYPKAYTALGHMYYFGRGVDISDEVTTMSARLQAQEYYQGYMGNMSDPEGQFMMGFLLEQEQNPESDDQAEHYYQIAASEGHSPSAFRLGVRAEQGQRNGMNISEFYSQAEEFYSQAFKNPKPPSFISTLIGMPEDLMIKVNLAKKFQENLEGLETPTYALLDVIFCQHLRTNVCTILMPYWIDLSLASYAKKHNLPYKQDLIETTKHVKDIATLLNGTSPTQTIPDLTSHDQKMLNIQNAKNTFHNPAAQLMRGQQIRQYLSQEDENGTWLDIPFSGTKKYADIWLEEVKPLVNGLNDLSKTFSGEPFLKTLAQRIDILPTAEHKVDLSIAHWPQEYFDDLAKELSLLKEEAQAIFKALPSHQRSLSQQILTYKNLQEIKKYTGESLSSEVLQNLLLAQKLMMVASQGENQPDKLVKHFQSARALIGYALSQKLSTDDAKKELDQKAKAILPLLSPELHDLSIIGYDVILNLIASKNSATWDDVSADYRAKLLITLNQDDLDNIWIHDNSIRSLLSGQSNSAAAALTQLYKQAKTCIMEAEPLITDKPVLNLATLTYEDPHIGLYGNIVPNALKDLKEETQNLHMEGILGLPEQEIYASLLDREILLIRNTISSFLPQMLEIDLNEFDNITSVIDSAPVSPFQKIERKENFLFVLRKSADWKNPNLEQISLATYEIINGTKGRCPDGQADFTQKWVLSYILNNLGKEMKVDIQTSLKIALSVWLQNYKSTFIEKHSSPFLIGKDKWTTNENRTAMPHLLTQALRLPFSLIGSYNSVRYPSFAIHTLKNPGAVLQIKTVIDRFLNGGSIIYADERITIAEDQTPIYHDIDEDGAPVLHEEKISFPALTFKSLGQTLREAFVELPKDRKKPVAPTTGLLPLPRLDFGFKQELIENFLQHDSILASFYSTFIHSGFTKGNKFFDSQAAFNKGYHLQHVLKDAAILRILDVGGYAKLPAEFYQDLPNNWKFE